MKSPLAFRRQKPAVTLFRLFSAGGLLVLAATAQAATLRYGPIGLHATAVPLDPRDAGHERIGAFRYAGGLQLESRTTTALHELSDLEVVGDRLYAVGDSGVRFEARLLLGAGQRLIGLDQGRLYPLTDLAGQPLRQAEAADAEGMTRLANGDWLVSFERQDRIWLYPATGGKPRAIPAPRAKFPHNLGMEALGADPQTAPDAYLVGAEQSGRTWHCRLSRPDCTPGPTVAKAANFGLVALKRLPGNRTVYLLRAFDPATRINRNSLQLFQGSRKIAELDFANPLTIDNFEGVAAVPRPNGGLRFYLISDDNVNPRQRTYLMAFDWQ